jgi:hypothetical protein
VIQLNIPLSMYELLTVNYINNIWSGIRVPGTYNMGWGPRNDLQQYSSLSRYDFATDTFNNLIYIYGGMNPTNDGTWNDIILMDTGDSSKRARINAFSGYAPDGGRFLASAKSFGDGWLYVHGVVDSVVILPLILESPCWV